MREVERAELRAVARLGAVRGSGEVVLVEGPPGIGKTWLLQDAAAHAARVGAVASSARGHELEQRVPYGVVRGLLEPALAGHDAALEGAGAVGARVLRAAAGEPGRAEEAGGVVHGLYALTAVLAAGAPRALLMDDARQTPACSWSSRGRRSRRASRRARRGCARCCATRSSLPRARSWRSSSAMRWRASRRIPRRRLR